MRALQLQRRSWFFVFFGIIASISCKPRKDAKLFDRVEELTAQRFDEYERIEEAIAAMEALSLQSTNFGLLDDALCKEKSEPTRGDDGKLNLEVCLTPRDEKTNTFAGRPTNCPVKGWQSDLAWNSPVLSKLYNYIVDGNEHLPVRLKALEKLAEITSREQLFCHQQVIEELLPRIMDKAPDPDYVYNGNFSEEANQASGDVCGHVKQDRAPRYWRCSSMLRCAQTRETLHKLADVLYNSRNFESYLCEARHAAAFLDYSGSVATMLAYQFDSTIAHQQFLKTTQMRRPDLAGRAVELTGEEFSRLQKRYQVLISRYKALFASRNNTYTAAGINAEVMAELIERDIIGIENLNETELDEDQFIAITEYARSILEVVPSLFEYNFGTYLYLSRISGNPNPRGWIAELKDRVALGKKLAEKVADQQFLESRLARSERREPDVVEGLSRDETVEVYDRASKRAPQDGEVPFAISPVVAIRALLNFADYEIGMPYANQFHQGIWYFLNEVAMMKDEWGGQIGEKIIERLIPDIYAVQGHMQARQSQMDQAAPLLVKATGVRYLDQLDPYLKNAYEKQRRRLQVLIEREPDIASDPEMAGFHSVQFQLQKLAEALSRHSFALHAYHCTLRKNDDEMPGCVDENGESLYQEGWWDAIYRSWRDPASGRNKQKFTMIGHYGDLVGTWITFNCIAMLHDRSATKAVIEESFFVDGREISFDCGKYDNYAQLSAAALSYGSNLSQKEVEKLLHEAIKNHPALHTMLVVAVGPALGAFGPLSMLTSRAFHGLALAVRSSTLARVAVAGLGRVTDLVIQSYLFGVVEHFGSDMQGRWVSSQLGFKPEYSAIEKAMHPSPYTNWAGVAQGALIFGAIPLAHGAAAKLVSVGLRRGRMAAAVNAYAQTAALPSQVGRLIPMKDKLLAWTYHATSGVAQSAAEWGLFAGMPIIQSKGSEFFARISGAYREPTDFDRIMERMYQPSMAENMVNSLLTVAAFSANRYTGTFVNKRLMGHPPHQKVPNKFEQILRDGYKVGQTKHEINYMRIKWSEWNSLWRGEHRVDQGSSVGGKSKRNRALWVLGLNSRGGRSRERIEEAYHHKLSQHVSVIRQMQQTSGVHPRELAAMNIKVRRLEEAKNLLASSLAPHTP